MTSLAMRPRPKTLAPRAAARLIVAGLALLLGLSGTTFNGLAQSGKSGTIFVPVFSDLDRRMEHRGSTKLTQIRFLTEDDYPPFHYIAPDGTLSGFNIDLARMICAELATNCTIQPRRWDTLLPAIENGAGDAVIASHRIDAELRRRFEVSNVIYRVPARFVGRKTSGFTSADVAALGGRSVAVIGGSAHEAYLNAFFPNVRLMRFPTLERALETMRRGEADLAFADGVSLAFWLNGTDSLDCCTFVDGPFTESRFFGEGAGIVMQKGNVELRSSIDYALWRISRDGRFARLYLKHFPVPFY